ncbi:MAG: class I SAM-dependent methyltransferase [Desulfuromonadales bacterium]
MTDHEFSTQEHDQPDHSRSSESNNANEITIAMNKLYDYYYTSREYSRRYPKPNRSTLEFLFRHGAGKATNILDYGCGNGRYALPLLQQTQATITCFDISQPAIDEIAAYVQGSPLAARVRMFCGSSALLENQGRYDFIMLMFGVLSHVGNRSDRIKTLQHMRRLISDHGRLILTVPSKFRRRPMELLYSKLRRMSGSVPECLKERGNIFFTRTIADEDHLFFYHLYTVNGLKKELLEAGFELRTMSPESILPEWLITQSDLLGKIDAALLPLLPASLGYGICIVADPV